MDVKLNERQAVVAKRQNICAGCPELTKTIQICKQCGCFMPAKIWLMDAWCPLKKWDKEDI